MSSVWQNQRHYVLPGWYPPPPFECPQYTYDDGEAAEFDKETEPSAESALWKVLVSSHTDLQGWEYGTNFSTIEQDREGGRASKRVMDTVRRRRWVKKISEAADFHPPARNQMRPLTLYRGLQAFIGIFSEVLQRRQIWEVLPWDPGAWLVVHADHQEYFRALLALETAISRSAIQINRVTKETMEDIRCAVYHARAAYGYVMRAGHMESMDKVVMLHAVQNIFFDPVTGASENANRKAVCSLTGICEDDLLMAEWSNSQYRPCHYIALDRKRKRVMLVIRGSIEIGDVITDVTGQPLSVSLGGVTGKVHSGVMSAATYVQCCTQSILEKAARDCPGWPLLITGHSLGGGVASLLALLLREANFGFKDIYAVGIGSASVMSEELAECCSGFVTTVIQRGDVVPRLSCQSIESLLLELTKASPTKRAINGLVQSAASALKTVKDTLFQEVASSEQQQYIQMGWQSSNPGLKVLESLLEDDDAIGRAARATHDALDSSIERIPEKGCLKTDEQQSDVAAEAHACTGSSSKMSTPGALSEGIFPGGSGSFAPMYPAGMVYWILPGASGKGENQKEKKQEIDWWKKLQDWGKEAFVKTTSAMGTSPVPPDPVDKDKEDSRGQCGSEVEKNKIHDLQWIEMKIVEELKEAKQIAEDNTHDTVGSSTEEAHTSVCNAPEVINTARSTDGVGGNDAESEELQRSAVIMETERKSFGRILLHPDMMSDHIPDVYFNAIESLWNEMQASDQWWPEVCTNT